MAVPKDTIWPIEAHTVAKHAILRNYLNAWFPILSRYHNRVVYLDGFAGPGIYKGGQPGSPIIALQTALQHFRPIKGEAIFIFVDDNSDRIQNLRNEVAKLKLPANYRVHYAHGEFEKVVGKILDDVERANASLPPTFAFVDPFGFSGLPFDLMRRLRMHDRSEVFITFMVDSINRFLAAPNESIKEHLVHLFGTRDVLSVAYSGNNRIQRLARLYQQQLGTIGKFVRSFEMRDIDDRTIYYLQFASNHSLGHQKMKEAMWQVDSEGDFRFSDATDPSQHLLLRKDHTQHLLSLITSEFRGQKIDVSVVRKFVRDQTPFIDTHLVGSLKRAESESTILVDSFKVDGTKRRRNSFPDGVMITFL